MACKIKKTALKVMQKKCSSQKIYNRIPAFRLKNVRYKMGRINYVRIKFTFQVSPIVQKMSVKYRGGFKMPKKYNTSKCSVVVKTRMTNEEYTDFSERAKFC